MNTHTTQTKSATVGVGSVDSGSGSIEIISGAHKITGLRWAANGKLQYCLEQKYEQWEGGRPVAGGVRETWKDVESECPNVVHEPQARQKTPNESSQ